MTLEEHKLNKRALARKTKAAEFTALKGSVYSSLKEHGPCTARTLANKLGNNSQVTVRSVSNALAVLRRESKVEVVSSRNDVKTWKVI